MDVKRKESVGEVVGIILVDHGSKRPAANAMLHDVVEMFKRVSGQKVVEAAHMELAAPTIGEAFAACVAQGAGRVLIHPYFLSPGRHSTTDIPRMAQEAAAEFPGVSYHVTQPLGLDDRIAEVMMSRLAHCVANDYQCAACQCRTAPPSAIDAALEFSEDANVLTNR